MTMKGGRNRLTKGGFVFTCTIDIKEANKPNHDWKQYSTGELFANKNRGDFLYDGIHDGISDEDGLRFNKLIREELSTREHIRTVAQAKMERQAKAKAQRNR